MENLDTKAITGTYPQTADKYYSIQFRFNIPEKEFNSDILNQLISLLEEHNYTYSLRQFSVDNW